MAVSKRSVYVFELPTDGGIFDVPEDRIILVESTNELWLKKDNNGLDDSKTVQDAINSGNLIPPNNVWNPNNDGVGSDLDAALWGGHRLIAISVDEPTAADGVDGDIWFQRDS
jgi:hypothetical protein